MKGYTLIKLPQEEEYVDRFGVKNSKKELVAEMQLAYDRSGWSIPFLYVREEDRRKGIGTMLLQNIMEPIADSDVFIPVEMYFSGPNADGMSGFMGSQPNFSLEEDKSLYRIPAKLRRKNPEWKKLKKDSENVTEFFKIKPAQRNRFFAAVNEAGYGRFVTTDESEYENHLTFGYLDGDKVTGALFTKKHSDEELELSFFYTDGKHPRAARELIGAAMEAADELYPDAEIWFCAVTPEASGIADGLFGEEIEPESIFIARWNGWGRSDYEDLEKLVKVRV